MDNRRLRNFISIQINLWRLSLIRDIQGPIKNKEHPLGSEQDPTKNVWIMLRPFLETKGHDTKDLNKSTDFWPQLYKKVEIFLKIDRGFSWKHMEVTRKGEESNTGVGYICREGEFHLRDFNEITGISIVAKNHQEIYWAIILHLNVANSLQPKREINKGFQPLLEIIIRP